ncbi:ornithine cyclodeaminase/alanine dehydrogenase-like protein (mu-crystallin family) [Nonomuraea rubra]|uniref:Ornithine cyclodeaminase/alanine dehydrogenase-like protein (Mu-crystallin family) n=1 Tax=Nonomuraea rubra TaxID=46180 RepID=A0A7X0TX24_9ACTN|nr:hypothetical protein [Nonomuraea rubra]MBB6546958.1 ornithine cyclodeaminase/alanine dehydrogenase-like protein (mu-crystallin family) [Nonomuraea rubra]
MFEPVRTALIAYSDAATQAIPIGLLDLPGRAEVHVKAGYVPGLPVFAVKVATMFPVLRTSGLNGSNGLVIACDVATCEPLAVLHDRKLLTDLCTAAVGGLATDALARTDATTVSVFGTGDRHECRSSPHVTYDR